MARSRHAIAQDIGELMLRVHELEHEDMDRDTQQPATEARQEPKGHAPTKASVTKVSAWSAKMGA